MIIGTSYFPSESHAVKYYLEVEFEGSKAKGIRKLAQATVRRKISEGAIHIGKPEVKAGETLVTIDEGTRYAIVEP